ncbi:hypothetical protein NP233_g8181 [Leucocoprinus birnbaumii]|uniref:Uncharacterized protein n=1 Tax=Leucocoprinus birnbaumii TaxID=56174 RepID=A0AAD5YS38_9AGAR|nr:hypothetical protein NP233_g8181 [Leucocoprinus birnbaumii]
MAPGNSENKYLDAPFVNMHTLKTDNTFEDRLVRMYDIVNAKFETSDKDKLIANLQVAYPSVNGGKFQASVVLYVPCFGSSQAHQPFKLQDKYYLLEGISRDSGRSFVLMRAPEPLDLEDMIDVLNDITEFMNDKCWLEARGVIPPDPRLDHNYEGDEKPPLLKAMAPLEPSTSPSP